MRMRPLLCATTLERSGSVSVPFGETVDPVLIDEAAGFDRFAAQLPAVDFDTELAECGHQNSDTPAAR